MAMVSFPKNSLSVPNEIERILRHFQGRLHEDCYIIGNGQSSAEVRLSDEQIQESVIFRTNWFFLEAEQFYGNRVDGFFWSVDNKGLRDNLSEIQRLDRYQIGAFFQPFQASNLREKVVTDEAEDLLPNFDHWAVIASNATLARFMMGRPLPTQGMQMIATAAILGFKKIYIAGIDLYSDLSKRYAWDVPDHIRAHLQDKDTAAGYEEKHSLDLDLHFLRAVREQYDFELIGLSNMELLAPYLDRKERRQASPRSTWSVDQKNTYVTLADGPYALGAMALARSLANLTEVPLLVLHTDEHIPRMLRHLPNVTTRKVDPIDNPHNHGQSRFVGTFTKLRVFELTEYRRVTFLDADCVVLKDINNLFEEEGFWAAPDWGMELNLDFNSGVFSFSPTEILRDKVMSAVAVAESSDGGDQGFLNSVLGNEVHWLPPEYNTLKRLLTHHPNLINLNDVKVLHFVGDKPWDMHKLRPEYAVLEKTWLSFLETADLRQLFWLNKKMGTKTLASNSHASQKHANKEFKTRLQSYDPVRRTVVAIGDKVLPPALARPIDRFLKKAGIL